MNAAHAGAGAPLDPALRTPPRSVAGGAARLRGASRRPLAFALPAALLGMLVAGGAAPLAAQEAARDAAPAGDAAPAESERREMTVEELERFIAEQKAALDEVRRNREITADRAREVRAELDEREARRRETEAELEALCKERESLRPGSYEDCVAPLAER